MNIVVIGGGLAGLSAALKAAEAGCHVKLVSVTKVKRSHSVCAQGGINAAMNTRGEGDSPYIHAFETIKGGGFLIDQPAVLEMCLAAPKIIHMLDRFGCPFNRSPEGNLDFRGFGGTLYKRTAFCGASTGQQLMYALDEQVRHYEVKGLIEKFENHEFLRLIRDEEGRARGIVIADLYNMKLETLRGDAVVVATGGCGLVFGTGSTNSTFCTGAANGRLYMQGMHYANGEFVQIHPTTIPMEDKHRLISESVRGEGGRVWVPGDASKSIETPDGRTIPCGKTGEPWYFLEELYPAYGNLVPRDIGARELLRICSMGLGIDGTNSVYLDVTHLPPETHKKLDAVLDIYQKFTGDDPRKIPMRVFPGVHYTMGGAWVDWPSADDPDREDRFRQMTNIPGLFAVGEADFHYHGANRLGANSLMSCIFGGLVTGQEVARYCKGLEKSYCDFPEMLFDDELTAEEERRDAFLAQEGTENVFELFEEMGDLMMANCTVRRTNADLDRTIEKLYSIRKRYGRIGLSDTSRFANSAFWFAYRFGAMIELALVIAKGARWREESRGSHYKPETPEQDDEHWLVHTIAEYSPDGPKLSKKEIDLRHWDSVSRDYVHKAHAVPDPKSVPDKIVFPL